MMRGGMPAEIERYILGWKDIQLDGRTLLFTLAAAVLSGILAGLAPAWQCSRPNLTDALKEGGRGGTAGGARHRLRNILVASEVALAVVLLVGAGLMVRGFRKLVENGERLEPATLLTMRLALTDNKYHEPLPAHRLLPRRAGPHPRAARRAQRRRRHGAALQRPFQRARLHHRRPARRTRTSSPTACTR